MIFFCRPTVPDEIITLLFNTKSNTSSGFDNIDPQIFREINCQIALPLTHIFNSSFQHKLTIAKVILIYKSNNPQMFCNYRPIPVLPCLSKILERLMYNQLEHFLNQSHVISENQFDFRKNTLLKWRLSTL